jgi:phosphoribosylformimino-5-aminoimidazole carboxamide ribotide isomerase
MEVIPSMTLKAGNSILRTQGKLEQANLLTADPGKIAKRWVDEGAKRLHIHDVDGARTGIPENREIIRDIRRRYGVPVQYSGGVRGPETVERLFAIGVDRVVVTINTMADAPIVDQTRRFGDRIIVAVVHDAGAVAALAQPMSQKLALPAVLQQLRTMGAVRFLLMPAGDVDSVRPDTALIGHVVREAHAPVIVAGNITSIPEVEALRDAGAEAVILGKSIYDNVVRFPHAIAVGDPG